MGLFRLLLGSSRETTTWLCRCNPRGIPEIYTTLLHKIQPSAITLSPFRLWTLSTLFDHIVIMSQSEPTSPPNGASLVLTICASKKDALGEAEFHDYLTHSHAPLVKQVLARHGITRYTMASPHLRWLHNEDIHANPICFLDRPTTQPRRKASWQRWWTPSSVSSCNTTSLPRFDFPACKVSWTSEMIHSTKKWLCLITTCSRMQTRHLSRLDGLRTILLMGVQHRECVLLEWFFMKRKK